METSVLSYFDAMTTSIPSAAFFTRKIFVIVVSIIAICLTASLFHPQVYPHSLSRLPLDRKTHRRAKTSALTSNTTLGFEKVFYISLPERQDRQDGMALMCAFSDFTATMITGVDGEAMADKLKWSGAKLGKGQYGCWRSHANIWRKMMDERISTALIMEDDADWDVDIKDQLFRLSQTMLNNPSLMTSFNGSVGEERWYDRADAPYGDDWDILWVGTCITRAGPDPAARGTVLTYYDPATLEVEQLSKIYQEALQAYGVTEDGVKVVVRAHDTVCTTAYAVTRRGASRLLYQMGYLDPEHPVDNLMSWLQQDNKLRAVDVIPPLFQQYKLGGKMDSNINGHDEKAKDPAGSEGGKSPNIKNPARGALKDWVQWS